MNFTEESGEQIKTIDINTLIVPKKKGRPKKAEQKSATEPTVGLDPLTEKEQLKEQLMRLSDYHPEIVSKPINDKIAKLVEDMDLDELRERVRYGKRNQSSAMDDAVSGQAIMMANQVAGRMLGCLEELNESSLKDKLLGECVKQYLTLNILDYIPNELKIMGLYGSHVSSAYYTNSLKKTPRIVEPEIDPEMDEEEARDAIKKAMADNPAMKEKMESIKIKMAGLGL